jgi:hypothetical protein
MLNDPVSSLLSTAILLNAILHDVILLNVVAPQTFTTPALLEYPKLAKVLESFFKMIIFLFPAKFVKKTPNLQKKLRFQLEGRHHPKILRLNRSA